MRSRLLWRSGLGMVHMLLEIRCFSLSLFSVYMNLINIFIRTCINGKNYMCTSDARITTTESCGTDFQSGRQPSLIRVRH